MLITLLNITTYASRSEIVVQNDVDYFSVVHGLKKIGNHCIKSLQVVFWDTLLLYHESLTVFGPVKFSTTFTIFTFDLLQLCFAIIIQDSQHSTSNHT